MDDCLYYYCCHILENCIYFPFCKFIEMSSKSGHLDKSNRYVILQVTDTRLCTCHMNKIQIQTAFSVPKVFWK